MKDSEEKLNIDKITSAPSGAEYYRAQAAAHKAALKNTWKNFLTAGLVTIGTCICMVVVTIAWFASVRQVDAKNTISTKAMPASLYIESGDLTTGSDYQSAYQYTTSVDVSAMSGNLYPVSMQPDSGSMSNASWWYASTWEGNVCSGYAEASISQSTESGKTDQHIYTGENDNAVHTAYNLAEYTVYCNEGGEMDVYLDPANPISILSSTEDSKNPKQLMNAIRVGIAVDGELVFVYTPAETGTGNSKGAGSGYYMVSGADSIDSPSYAVGADIINNYTANVDEDGNYTAGTTKLCTTDYDGAVIGVYVWLEGTDAEAMLGKSDSADVVNVQFNLVGIETTDNS